jgi:hypothetical protein
MAGGVIQELRRLTVVSQLDPREALARHERRRRRADRAMIVVAVVFVLGAIGALVAHRLLP